EPVLRVLDDAIAVYGGTGQVRERIGSGTESAVPHNHYRTRDARWIAIACTNDRMFARLLQAMDRPDLAGDARVTTTPARLGNRALVDGLVAGWVGERDAAEALAALGAADVPSSLVASVRDLFEDAHVRAARTSSPRCCRCSAGSRCRGSFRASPPRRDGSRAPGRRRPASTTRRSTAAGWGSRRPS